MAAPFCTACGAAVADGTRFCVKCGQPVGQATTPPPTQTLVFAPPPPPPPPPPVLAESTVWTPPPPPPPPGQNIPPIMAPPFPTKSGPGAGLWIGIIGILLLFGGAGFWFYTTRAHSILTAQDATPPSPVTAQPSPTPTPEASTFVPPPTPNPTTEVIPPNPDQPQKPAAPPATPPQSRQPAQTRPAVTNPPADPAPTDSPRSDPAPPQPVRVARQTSGVLHAAVEVAQNGEVVFENLPGTRLRFTFDHSLWQPTISRQPNGTQTLVMRSLKADIQTTCDVRWEIVP